jgi:hypothetical protein
MFNLILENTFVDVPTTSGEVVSPSYKILGHPKEITDTDGLLFKIPQLKKTQEGLLGEVLCHVWGHGPPQEGVHAQRTRLIELHDDPGAGLGGAALGKVLGPWCHDEIRAPTVPTHFRIPVP